MVPVGINYRLTPDEAAYIARDATAKLLFCDSDLIADVDPLCSELSSVCLFGEHDDYPCFDQWLEAALLSKERSAVTADDVMSQMYTSGTTGLPKGVLLSHSNIISNVYQTAMASEFTFMVGDEFLLVAPMYHAAGIMIAYTGLMQGLTTRHPSRIRFNAGR